MTTTPRTTAYRQNNGRWIGEADNGQGAQIVQTATEYTLKADAIKSAARIWNQKYGV